MTTSCSINPNRSSGRNIKLLRYTPRSGGPSRIVGAVWKNQIEVHWASPLLQKHNNVLDPQPFITRFPDAPYDFDHFSGAMAWLESICYGAKEPFEVTRACEADSDLGLTCTLYKGSGPGGDLTSLLGGDGPMQLLNPDLLRTAVELTLEHLVKEHAVLKGLQLEILQYGGSECARLHLSGDRLVHIYFDHATPPSHVITKLLFEQERLAQLMPKQDIFFFVFAQIKTALPMSLMSNLIATGMRLPHIANGLIRIVWDKPVVKAKLLAAQRQSKSNF